MIDELPFAYEEVTGIRENLGSGAVISGVDLTKNIFFISLSNNILPLASHSNTNTENILENYIYVRDIKGRLTKVYGREIVNKNNNLDLVVLSSCNSGVGGYRPGAGVFALSREFMEAGAQTVIKSLWPVNDYTTSILMHSFYRHLRRYYE